jgi:hypothetical protein
MAVDDLGRRTNFVLQQGFDAPPPASCSRTYSALQFQPRIVGVVALAAAIVQSWIVFAALGAVLWWSALLPRWNPFELVYNRFRAARSGHVLTPAPPPRRFAQFLAGLLSIISAALLVLGLRMAAIVVEVLLLAAIAALVFGGFCAGSYIFHLLRGRKRFANRTLPWSKGTNSA